MNSLPAEPRGAGGGMNQTFQNSAQVLSIGIFFTLMIMALSARLPETLAGGLVAHGGPPDTAPQVAHLPPIRRGEATHRHAHQQVTLTDKGREALTIDRERREGWLADVVAQKLNKKERRMLLDAIPLIQRLAQDTEASRHTP